MGESDLKRTGLLTWVALAAFASGCASGPAPEPELARARARVEQAQQAGAAQAGGASLDAGQTALRQAEEAAAKGKDEEAIRLARQAELEAELAEAKARRQQAETAANEVRAATGALREESERALDTSTPPTVAPTPATPGMPAPPMRGPVTPEGSTP